MHEPKGRYLSPTGPRGFINDLVHFAHKVPSAPVSRTFNVSALRDPRIRHLSRPSWSCLFMKAYALVGSEHAPLRRSYLEFPWPRIYEHPYMNCALAIERTYQGEEGVFVGLFRAPEQQSLVQLQAALRWYKHEPLEKVGFYRQALRFSKVPRPVRRFLWWSTLNISGFKRCKRFGTFGLSSYGALGAEQIHPISPLTTTLTFGPIDPVAGRVMVKLIYDHRVLDGAFVARRLREIEEVLNGAILDELLKDPGPAPAQEPPRNVEPLLKPHLPGLAPPQVSGFADQPAVNQRSGAAEPA
ncbi:hypothetical protein [Paludisphaera borealis]|uniref:2-oxoacid dehydrogenase acyltransferase catalytic domain-containing protein n=1 Tax=Paludisphaera borealis TaxID=1387353 RepID=A0A1U7CXZ6_9BACT|nr:hypothetical protein [Paludisphaera borealis]APW63817.1 hypothetical protein BSF38_05394 [Paludisphaera borealis]